MQPNNKSSSFCTLLSELRELIEVAFQYAIDDISSRPPDVSPPVTQCIPAQTLHQLFSFHNFSGLQPIGNSEFHAALGYQRKFHEKVKLCQKILSQPMDRQLYDLMKKYLFFLRKQPEEQMVNFRVALQRSHQMVDEYLDRTEKETRRVDISRSIINENRTMKQLESIASQLNLDYTGQEGSVLLGTKGANGTCFAAEITIGPSPHDASKRVVQNVETTYMLGERINSYDDANSQLRDLLVKGEFQLIQRKLSRIRMMEELGLW